MTEPASALPALRRYRVRCWFEQPKERDFPDHDFTTPPQHGPPDLEEMAEWFFTNAVESDSDYAMEDDEEREVFVCLDDGPLRSVTITASVSVHYAAELGRVVPCP